MSNTDTDTKLMRPGLLVALKTHVRGGVEYRREDLEGDDEGKFVKWETTRLMEDPAEHDAAVKAAGAASRLVSKLCVHTEFGLLCLLTKEGELDAAVAEARAKVNAFNEQAKTCKIQVHTVKARIADNDAEAIRALVDEARDLLDAMQLGIKNADVEAIRDAATALKSKRLADIMTPQSSSWVNTAMEAARETATALVRRAGNLGNTALNSVIEVETESFTTARMEFLELSSKTIEALPSVDMQRGAGLEV